METSEVQTLECFYCRQHSDGAVAYREEFRIVVDREKYWADQRFTYVGPVIKGFRSPRCNCVTICRECESVRRRQMLAMLDDEQIWKARRTWAAAYAGSSIWLLVVAIAAIYWGATDSWTIVVAVGSLVLAVTGILYWRGRPRMAFEDEAATSARRSLEDAATSLLESLGGGGVIETSEGQEDDMVISVSRGLATPEQFARSKQRGSKAHVFNCVSYPKTIAARVRHALGRPSRISKGRALLSEAVSLGIVVNEWKPGHIGEEWWGNLDRSQGGVEAQNYLDRHFKRL